MFSVIPEGLAESFSIKTFVAVSISRASGGYGHSSSGTRGEDGGSSIAGRPLELSK
ncbi:hypothetical protein [Prochlorococcus sp. MIT 1201]|uniref:hypothetical protein n=1 Tax=Prochlorococcus sp. MIT 1201 TaxID=3082535 RepID=UPI0039A407E0